MTVAIEMGHTTAGASATLDLEELLARPVDLVTERSLRERMREKILREAIAL